MFLPQVRDDCPGSEATGCGGDGGGREYSRNFAFRGLKVSDLAHSLGDFVGILSIQKIKKKIKTCSQKMCPT